MLLYNNIFFQISFKNIFISIEGVGGGVEGGLFLCFWAIQLIVSLLHMLKLPDFWCQYDRKNKFGAYTCNDE